jgi:endonuclease III
VAQQTLIFEILEKDHQPTMLEQFQQYNQLQILIATLLSSRTKDSTTIPIAKKLFKKYQTAKDFLNLKEEEIFGIGFYRVKTKNIHKLSKIISEKYNNQVPDTVEELISLPGVGRKTANCMLNYVFNKPAIAVDIHVHRISNRLGWIKTKNETETEQKLMETLPKESWNKVNKLFVNHGQTICLPRNPKCKECKIKDYCKKLFS